MIRSASHCGSCTRWPSVARIQAWPRVCSDLVSAPSVLAVGDLHVENFGTWRDAEGRLIWGINDFDETWRFPYTNDLVRLAASANLAINTTHLSLHAKTAAEAILEGYRDALKAGGRPFVLAENHLELRKMAVARLHDPGTFWRKLEAVRTWRGRPPKSVLAALSSLMPEKNLPCRIVHRIAGLGSLGRERFVALADWRGGKVAREAKALALSAAAWAQKAKGADSLYQDVLDRSIRCLDPFVRMRGKWILRRLAPDCSRIELADLPKERDEALLLYCMGWETANVHLGSAKARSLLSDLKNRPSAWLHDAAASMVKAVMQDWEDWRRS